MLPPGHLFCWGTKPCFPGSKRLLPGVDILLPGGEVLCPGGKCCFPEAKFCFLEGSCASWGRNAASQKRLCSSGAPNFVSPAECCFLEAKFVCRRRASHCADVGCTASRKLVLCQIIMCCIPTRRRMLSALHDTMHQEILRHSRSSVFHRVISLPF